jgi:uncharacterized cupin superfamily protein
MAEQAHPLVAHIDDAREMTEFGDPRDDGAGVARRDAVWYLHRDDTEGRTFRCGVFHVVPGRSAFTMPYHETIVTLAGEGRTEIAGQDPIDVRPGMLHHLAEGMDVAFNPTALNREFFVVVEPPAQLDCGIAELPAGDHERVEETDRASCILAGAATLTFEDGREEQLRAGSFAFLPRGARSRWHVSEPLREAFTEVR